MNRKFLFLLPIALLLLIALKLHAKSSETFFCKVITSPEATVVRDDSAIVSIYLFATKPMGDIELSPESPKGEDCKLRLLYLNKQGRRQAITQVDGKSYYTVLCAQYSLIGANKGRCTFPSISIDANLYIEQETPRSQDPFDLFFSRPTYKKEKVSTHTQSLHIQITDPPAKTTRELKQMGKQVI